MPKSMDFRSMDILTFGASSMLFGSTFIPTSYHLSMTYTPIQYLKALKSIPKACFKVFAIDLPEASGFSRNLFKMISRVSISFDDILEII